MAPAIPDRAGSVRHSACLAPGLLEAARQPALVVLDYNLPGLAESSFAIHVSRLLDPGISRVGVGHGENHAAALDRPRQVLGLLGGMDHRLVEYDVEAGLGERVRHWEMEVVRGYDANEVGAPFFG